MVSNQIHVCNIKLEEILKYLIMQHNIKRALWLRFRQFILIRNFLYDIETFLRFFSALDRYVILNCFSIHNLVFMFLKISVLHSLLYITFKPRGLRTCIFLTKQNKYYSIVLKSWTILNKKKIAWIIYILTKSEMNKCYLHIHQMSTTVRN